MILENDPLFYYTTIPGYYSLYIRGGGE